MGSFISGQDAVLAEAPLPPSDVILSLRLGKVRPLANQNRLRSAIDKSAQDGLVKVTSLGLVGDEQQYEKHGGVDKALHHYSASHYPVWNELAPGRQHLFRIGGFGENISSSLLNEQNLCIGDTLRIGSEVVVQVSEPRQPCYKLNIRFEYKKTSTVAQSSGRTGWYYRVLVPGYVRQGDKIELFKRLHPRWSIANVQNVLYYDQTNIQAITELSELSELGEEIRDLFRARLAQGPEDMNGRLQGDRLPASWRPYKVVENTALTPRVNKLIFQVADAHAELDASEIQLDHFAHVRLQFGPEQVFSRAYSVVGGDMNRFELGIARDEQSRGGSAYLHDVLQVGDSVRVAKGHSLPVTRREERDSDGKDCISKRRHIFIVGGIGITAFVREIQLLNSQAMSASDELEVHYAVRSQAEAVYVNLLPRSQTTIYAKDQGQRLSLEHVVPAIESEPQTKSMIYCCGPPSLMAACEALTSRLKYPPAQTHFESFGDASAGTGEPFEAHAYPLNRTLQIPGDKSLLQVLRDAGVSEDDLASSCLVGNCGTCMVDIRDGEVEHRGTALDMEMKMGSMLSCVSRGKGKISIDW